MTTDMVRKQIYIHRRQQEVLRQLARQRGISEAEIIRRAIDRETTLRAVPLSETGGIALEEIIKAGFTLRDQLEAAGEPYRFNRAELYEERENRWIQGEKKIELPYHQMTSCKSGIQYTVRISGTDHAE